LKNDLFFFALVPHVEDDEELPIVLVYLRSLPNIEDVLEGQWMNSKVPPQSLNKFRVAKTIHVDPTDLVIVEAWQKFIHRLDFAFHDGVSIVLNQRNCGFLALILRRYYQGSRGGS